jgi:tetratricopeptide (TPR) repeat protein
MLIALIVTVAFTVFQASSKPEATSLLGKPLVPAPPAAESRKTLEENLARADAAYRAKPEDADALIWLGRRTAYLGRYRDAIQVFTTGIEKHPADARMYRHRGHRHITVRELDRALADLSKAAQLVANRPDEVEPDGQPNARQIPTSTLNSNIYYHLALASYLKGDFSRSLDAWRQCMTFSKNPDMLVATSHWLYMTLRRVGRTDEAAAVLAAISPDLDVIENTSYYKLLLMYKGLQNADALLASGAEGSLDAATIGYGIANWHLYNGRQDQAMALFRKIVDAHERQWPAFGYIAAEAELARAKAFHVHLDEAAQLLQRLRAVIHLEPEDDVVLKPGTAVFPDDEHRG